MDDKTLAAFRASGEKDLSVFLAKQGAQNQDLPPGVSGYSAGTQNFGSSGPRTPGTNFQDKISAGFSKLSGIPSAVGSALQSAGETLGILSPEAKPTPNILTALGRQGSLEAGLNDLEARSTTLRPNIINYRPAEAAFAAAAVDATQADKNAEFERAASAANTPKAPTIVTAADSRARQQNENGFLLPSERASGKTFNARTQLTDEERKRQQDQSERFAQR